MEPGTFGLAFLAGLLSSLSPCVLPLLPLVLGAAAAEHKWAPALLALGVALSFVVIGLFVATIGFAIGLDGDVFRAVAAGVMIALGVVLLVPPFQARVAAAGGPLSDRLNAAFGGARSSGLFGQFGVGLLLGAVWSPCVGPTLGAASVLASRGEDLLAVAATMGAFGLGAAVPLLGLGLLSRQAFVRWREPLLAAGKRLKQGLGALFVALGVLILSGVDKSLEAALVTASPQWLTELTTRF
ncbi:cytochrome c biogenesis CcdA family protein [Methylocystis parvus]|uniref:Cytochrome c biogenesis protein CcdA n=2 Tax=Methylocystis parvus TaxID=134 RepID=A0A6B8M8H3_9HYPH|nr:cytochrome c biogenesis CcdA family protein [Methylocystis parvus]QGM98886.1 cytochrome c biogenesis protein CcdA [Methylocystis parvus]WBK00758.1 cytochrome c biogenesis CcdA family protein [Methylocystis parvus OBBP]